MIVDTTFVLFAVLLFLGFALFLIRNRNRRNENDESEVSIDPPDESISSEPPDESDVSIDPRYEDYLAENLYRLIKYCTEGGYGHAASHLMTQLEECLSTPTQGYRKDVVFNEVKKKLSASLDQTDVRQKISDTIETVKSYGKKPCCSLLEKLLKDLLLSI